MNRLVRYRFSAILSALFSLTLQVTDSQAQNFSIQVNDAASGSGLDEATVELYCSGVLKASGTTSASGAVSFPVTVSTEPRESPTGIVTKPQVYPSPFLSRTRVTLGSPNGGTLTAAIYDALGRRLLLEIAEVIPGNHSFEVDLSGLPPGRYFLKTEVSGLLLESTTLLKTGAAVGAVSIRVVEGIGRDVDDGAVPGSVSGEAGKRLEAMGDCEIRVTREGFVDKVVPITISSGETTTVLMTPVGGGDTITNTIGMTFTRISAGAFRMGSTNGDSDEQPVHSVTISRDFYIGTYEVTQGQWQSFWGWNPSKFSSCGSDCPVEQVSWIDVIRFANALSSTEGLPRCYDHSGNVIGGAGGDVYKCTGYRLPTEAEWDYAARAGTTTEYSFGDDAGQLGQFGWYGSNSSSTNHPVGTTHPVGQKQPNPWGLYDVHGNVWEWVHDWYSSVYYGYSPASDPPGPSSGAVRVVRGGGWLGDAIILRSANRNNGTPGSRHGNLGFRLLRTAN